MKTWLIYVASLFFALAIAASFSINPSLVPYMVAASGYLFEALTVVLLLTTFFTFSAGVASLKHDKLFGRTVKYTLAWGVLTSILLSVFALLLFKLFPSSFSETSSTVATFESSVNSRSLGLSPFSFLSLTSRALPIVLVFALVWGLAITPTSDIIKPAYTVFNSLSETIYRLGKLIAYLGGLLVFVLGTIFFSALLNEKANFTKPFLILILGICVVIFGLLPLLYGCFTGFKKNPYFVLARSFTSAILALTSSNIYATLFVNQSITRTNIGTQKRISSVSLPLSLFVTRGGTAFVSIFATLVFLETLGATISLPGLLLVAALCFGLSFVSFLSPGFEVAIILFSVLRKLGLTTYGMEAMVVALLPLLNGLAIFLDTILSNFVASIISVRTNTYVKVLKKDTI